MKSFKTNCFVVIRAIETDLVTTGGKISLIDASSASEITFLYSFSVILKALNKGFGVIVTCPKIYC